jgi:hypothetical protein
MKVISILMVCAFLAQQPSLFSQQKIEKGHHHSVSTAGQQGQRGPQGPVGPRGLAGAPGVEGPRGPTGTSFQAAFAQGVLHVSDQREVTLGPVAFDETTIRSSSIVYNSDSHTFTVSEAGTYALDYFFQAWPTFDSQVIMPICIAIKINGQNFGLIKLVPCATAHLGAFAYLCSGTRRIFAQLPENAILSLEVVSLPTDECHYYGYDGDIGSYLTITKVQ